MPDYDDPKIEKQWCLERRDEVTTYLKREHIVPGRIGDWPAWHIAPYLSIWAIESACQPERLGWWVICGDLPTDYVSAENIKHPRGAMLAFGKLWQEAASFMARGIPHPEFSIGNSKDWPILARLLNSRAEILLRWAEDENLWDEEAL